MDTGYKTWNDLSMAEKAEMMKVAILNGITDLKEIRQRYNEFAEGGDTNLYSTGKLVNAIYDSSSKEEYMGEPWHHYDFTQSEEWADKHGYYPDARGHRDDRVKKPAHPSHPSRGNWRSNAVFDLTEKGMLDSNHTLFGLADGNQDSQAVLTYKGGTVLPEITVTPSNNYVNNPYDNIRLFAEGGHLVKRANKFEDGGPTEEEIIALNQTDPNTGERNPFYNRVEDTYGTVELPEIEVNTSWTPEGLRNSAARKGRQYMYDAMNQGYGVVGPLLSTIVSAPMDFYPMETLFSGLSNATRKGIVGIQSFVDDAVTNKGFAVSSPRIGKIRGKDVGQFTAWVPFDRPWSKGLSWINTGAPTAEGLPVQYITSKYSGEGRKLYDAVINKARKEGHPGIISGRQLVSAPKTYRTLEHYYPNRVKIDNLGHWSNDGMTGLYDGPKKWVYSIDEFLQAVAETPNERIHYLGAPRYRLETPSTVAKGSKNLAQASENLFQGNGRKVAPVTLPLVVGGSASSVGYNALQQKSLGGPLVDRAKKYGEGGNVDALEKDNELLDWIIREEGFNKKPEDIGDGKQTLGSGLTNPKWHRLYRERGNVWSAEDNRNAVSEEIAVRRKWLENNLPNWEKLPLNAKKALISYKYNFDFTKNNSPAMFKALKDEDWETAAKEMNATSKDPKFVEGLKARRGREQEWFLSGFDDLNKKKQEEPEILIQAPPRKEKKPNWLTRATLGAAVADNPAIAASTGWTVTPKGNVYQRAEAFEATAPEQKLQDNLAILSTIPYIAAGPELQGIADALAYSKYGRAITSGLTKYSDMVKASLNVK